MGQKAIGIVVIAQEEWEALTPLERAIRTQEAKAALEPVMKGMFEVLKEFSDQIPMGVLMMLAFECR